MKKSSVVNLNSSIYYKGKYWNDIPMVVQYMSKNFTGDPGKWWIEDFKERFAKTPFKRALFLNCGDGRHEIEFYDKKITKNIVAFDISPDLIAKAKRRKGRRRITFFVGDANTINFKKNEFDLIVNVAALHHVQYLNRLIKILSNSLRPNGIFVNFDYVGPHRNQYPLISWLIIRIINKILPKSVRKGPIGYPHIPTMLATDPTEAIHAEKVEGTIERYFEVLENHPTGGGIAYELLTHNQNLNTVKKNILNKYVKNILFLDYVLCKIGIAPNLFSYIIAKPNKDILKDKESIIYWQNREDLREYISSKNRGTYRLIDYARLVANNRNVRDRIYLLYQLYRNIPLLIKYHINIQ